MLVWCCGRQHLHGKEGYDEVANHLGNGVRPGMFGRKEDRLKWGLQSDEAESGY